MKGYWKSLAARSKREKLESMTTCVRENDVANQNASEILCIGPKSEITVTNFIPENEMTVQ